MITRIRNASLVRKDQAIIPFSKLKLAIAKILEKEGYLSGIEEKNTEHGNVLALGLKYVKGEPVIRGVKRISKPGRRVYNGYQDLPMWTPELGVAILSTSQGIMTHREAKKKKVGGEIICEIY